MNVIKPELQWMGNKRCYRVVTIAEKETEQKSNSNANAYIESDLYGDDCEEESCDIMEISPGRFKATIHVAQAFYGLLIGAKGATRNRIESETKTSIKIPRKGENGDVEIIGASIENVSSALRRIEIIVRSSRAKQSPTHFIGIPVRNVEIKSNFETFKQKILNGPSIFGLKETMFMKTSKLHLTIAVMSLMDDEDRLAATQYLNECVKQYFIPKKSELGKIMIKVRGIEIMNDDPSEVRVLYGRIESDVLQEIGDKIYQYFISKGLSKREFDRDTIKMHVTLINVRYGEDDENEDGATKKKGRRLHFDARSIMEEFSNFNFGEEEVKEIQLSVMHTEGSDGYYESTAHVVF